MVCSWTGAGWVKHKARLLRAGESVGGLPLRCGAPRSPAARADWRRSVQNSDLSRCDDCLCRGVTFRCGVYVDKKHPSRVVLSCSETGRLPPRSEQTPPRVLLGEEALSQRGRADFCTVGGSDRSTSRAIYRGGLGSVAIMRRGDCIPGSPCGGVQLSAHRVRIATTSESWAVGRQWAAPLGARIPLPVWRTPVRGPCW